MDVMLRMGIDGWKCDGTDPYIIELGMRVVQMSLPHVPVIVEPQSSVGPITYRYHCMSLPKMNVILVVNMPMPTTATSSTTHARTYARTGLHGAARVTQHRVLGDDRLIMSRPVDAEGPFYLQFRSVHICPAVPRSLTVGSPKYVMTSGWVGDQDDTFDGLKQALDRYLQVRHAACVSLAPHVSQSAWDGYANFGSDIGGYRTPQPNRSYDLLLRWAQLGSPVPSSRVC